MRIKSIFLLTVLAVIGVHAYAQSHDGTLINGQALNPNVITTAVPFVSIAPDARGGSMGDCGVSSEADVYSMHYNPAKYAFMDQKMSFGLGYSPWLHNLVKDMNLAYLAFATKLNSESAIGATLRYFRCGEITFMDATGHKIDDFSPNEWAMDVTYSRMLSDYLSAAVAGRFIFSNLTLGQNDTRPGWSVAADVAVYYKRPVEWFRDMDADFSWGVCINNIGSKVSYNDGSLEKDFIPTTLRFGPGLKLDIDEYNSLSFMVDVTKLLVPTPPIYARGDDGQYLYDENNELVIEAGMSDKVPVMVGMIQSFFDAPGETYDVDDGQLVNIGKAYEELCEYNYGIGAEYWYNDAFAVRAGYFHETALKGNRKYITLGAALKYTSFGLDVSYLVPVNGNKVGTNPLENTLRFNLSYDISSKK